jgi:hypothetical protein
MNYKDNSELIRVFAVNKLRDIDTMANVGVNEEVVK